MPVSAVLDIRKRFAVTFETTGKLESECSAYSMDNGLYTKREMLTWLIQLYKLDMVELVDVRGKQFQSCPVEYRSTPDSDSSTTKLAERQGFHK
jgi:hypothetical protein